MWWYVLSSLFCWLRQCWRRCVGCCVVVTVQKKREKNDICNFKKCPVREFISITVLINQSLQIYFNSKKSAPRISEIIFGEMARQHNSTSRNKKAAAKLHAWIPAAGSSGLRLVGCFFLADQNESKTSGRISLAFPASPKTLDGQYRIRDCVLQQGKRGEGGEGTSKPWRSCSILASARYNLADLYPAARKRQM